MDVFADFNIVDDTGTKVAEGHKASFCLEDSGCQNGIEKRFNCSNYGDQGNRFFLLTKFICLLIFNFHLTGISINCHDTYKYDIDCQWIDISELVPGVYKIEISINPEFKIPEISYDNNSAFCNLLYTETYARISDCVLKRPS